MGTVADPRYKYSRHPLFPGDRGPVIDRRSLAQRRAATASDDKLEETRRRARNTYVQAMRPLSSNKRRAPRLLGINDLERVRRERTAPPRPRRYPKYAPSVPRTNATAPPLSAPAIREVHHHHHHWGDRGKAQTAVADSTPPAAALQAPPAAATAPQAPPAATAPQAPPAAAPAPPFHCCQGGRCHGTTCMHVHQHGGHGMCGGCPYHGACGHPVRPVVMYQPYPVAYPTAATRAPPRPPSPPARAPEAPPTRGPTAPSPRRPFAPRRPPVRPRFVSMRKRRYQPRPARAPQPPKPDTPPTPSPLELLTAPVPPVAQPAQVAEARVPPPPPVALPPPPVPLPPPPPVSPPKPEAAPADPFLPGTAPAQGPSQFEVVYFNEDDDEDRYCAMCQGPIYGAAIEALGEVWHENHFVCAYDREPFVDHEFVVHDRMPYCEEHYHYLFSPRCDAKQCLRGDRIIRNSKLAALDKNYHPKCFRCVHCGDPFPDGAFYPWEGEPYCLEHYALASQTTCPSCGLAVHGQYVEYKGLKYHDRVACRVDAHDEGASTVLASGIWRDAVAGANAPSDRQAGSQDGSSAPQGSAQGAGQGESSGRRRRRRRKRKN